MCGILNPESGRNCQDFMPKPKLGEKTDRNESSDLWFAQVCTAFFDSTSNAPDLIPEVPVHVQGRPCTQFQQ